MNGANLFLDSISASWAAQRAMATIATIVAIDQPIEINTSTSMGGIIPI